MEDSKALIKETIAEIRKNSWVEKLKNYLITTIAGAAGALITVLLLAQWSAMDRKSEAAASKVTAMELSSAARIKSEDAQFAVLIDRIAKLESKEEAPKALPVPFAETPDQLEAWRESKEAIQQQIDTEVYRAEKR